VRLRAPGIALALMIAALPLLASEEGGGWMAPLWGLPTIAWQIFNLGLVIVLFYFLLRKSLPAFFATRGDSIRKELEKAVREKEAALARLREIEMKMANLNDEVAKIEKDAAAAAEVEKGRILKEAEAARERIREEAREELERRVAGARRELRNYAASLVEQFAREEILKGLGPADEDLLIEEFLHKMEGEGHERIG
jgi:F-type H+-transporting ATPase subunit b